MSEAKTYPDLEGDPGLEFLAVSRDEVMTFISTPFDSKKNCWVPDEEEGERAVALLALGNPDLIP